jgi:steroid 5-alpha reductase family enzyme
MLSLFLITLVTIFIYMTIWYFIALVLKRNDIADIAWGLGFIVVCSVMYFFGSKGPQFLIVFLLTLIWGLRLVIHIYFRNKGKSEDFRYKKWRSDWGKWFYVRTYLQVFLLQGFFMVLISFSAIISANSTSTDTTLSFIVYAGSLVWLIGFIFESVGDFQLTKFISNSKNKGKIMTQGLWKYTRHPNYFGEVTQWWGIFFIVLTVSNGFWAIISPLTITFLILKVSGIPMLEAKYKANKEFEKYKKVTNAFFPWIPKKTS